MKFGLDILRGVLIGIANVIPGVSGGTMMVSMGIYDDIISSITGIFKHFKKSITTLLPYFIGMALGIVGFSFAIGFLFEYFPLPTAFAFIGLIFGGLPILFQKAKEPKKSPINIVLFLVFFLLIIGMEFLGSSADKQLTFSFTTVLLMLVLGAVGSATMVIPGVSGSLILLALGYYNTIIDLISGFIKAVFSLDIAGVFSIVGILIPFGIGVIGGILGIAKLIEVLLAKFEKQTYHAILGLVLASPFSILMNAGFATLSIMTVLGSILTFGAGFGLSFWLGKVKE